MARFSAGGKASTESPKSGCAPGGGPGTIAPMSLLSRLSFARWLVVIALAACAQAPAEAPSNKPIPASIAEAHEQRRAGVEWDNAEIRAVYLRLVAAIGPANARWIAERLPAEDRARRAFQMRHDARLLTRAMMRDAAEVALLQRRDQDRYGHPDGPTFAWLVERERKKGEAGDAVFEAIVESAQRTDRAVNELFGVR